MFLDPHKWHGSESWDTGSRVLVVAYSLKGFEKASEDQKRVLREAGFPLPQSSCESCFGNDGVDGNSQASPSNTADGGVPASPETGHVSCALDGGVAASPETGHVSCALDGGVAASLETGHVSRALDGGVAAPQETSGVSSALEGDVTAPSGDSSDLDGGLSASQETGSVSRTLVGGDQASCSLDGSLKFQGTSLEPSSAVSRTLHAPCQEVGVGLGFGLEGGNSQASRSNTADGGQGMFLDGRSQQSSGVFQTLLVTSMPQQGPNVVSSSKPWYRVVLPQGVQVGRVSWLIVVRGVKGRRFPGPLMFKVVLCARCKILHAMRVSWIR